MLHYARLFQRAAALGENLEALPAAKVVGGHWRLFRTLSVYTAARTTGEIIDRIHQYCRVTQIAEVVTILAYPPRLTDMSDDPKDSVELRYFNRCLKIRESVAHTRKLCMESVWLFDDKSLLQTTFDWCREVYAALDAYDAARDAAMNMQGHWELPEGLRIEKIESSRRSTLMSPDANLSAATQKLNGEIARITRGGLERDLKPGFRA